MTTPASFFDTFGPRARAERRRLVAEAQRQAAALPLREGMEVTARGARCRIVSLDSDPRAVVLLVRVDDPDREVWAHRVEITVEV